MDVTTGLFYLFSAVLLFAAFRVITARNPVYAALYLVLAFFQASAIWLLLRAEFLAISLVLVYVEGLSYRELADVLGCPIGTVMSRLYRARKALESSLWECARRRGLVKEWKP